MHPALNAILLVIGVALLIQGANWLVDGAVAVARRLGASTLLIGLTIVAFGTSAPELAVNLLSAIDGYTGLAFGNVVGSNIANVGLVVGLGALTAPIAVHWRIVRLELPWLLVVSLAVIGLAYLPWTRCIGTADAAPSAGFARLDGVLMLAMFGAFFTWWVITARRDEGPALPAAEIDEMQLKPMRPLLAWTLLIVGLGLLLGGARLTEMTAVELASALGVGDEIIGLSIVAIATSLPEVVTVLVAVRRNEADLAVGNVVGSNIFNLLLVLAASAAIAEVPLPPGAAVDLLVMMVMTLLLWIVSATKGRTVSRIEGAVLVVLYVGYLVYRGIGSGT